MSDKLDWSLGMDDKSMTSASDRAASALERLTESMEKLGESTGKLDKKMAHGGEGVGRFMEKLHAGIEVAKRFGEVLKEVIEIPLEWTFEATSFKESTLLAMEAITGSAEKARGLFNYAEQFAGFAPFETKEVAHIQRRFIAGGFSGEESKSLMATATDFASLTGEGTAAMERFAFHVDQIKSVGVLQGHMVRELALSGINSERLYGKIAKYLGTDIPTAMERTRAGTVDWRTAIASVEDVITDLGGGKLGNLTFKVSHTVAGLFSTLKSRPFELFKDIDQTAGWGKMKSALENLVDALNPYNSNGPGARLKTNIEHFFSGLFDTIFGSFSGPDGADRIADTLDSIGDGIQKAGKYMEVAGAASKSFIQGLSEGLGVTDSIFGPDGNLDPGKMDRLKDVFHKMGTAIAYMVDKLEKAVGLTADLASTVTDNQTRTEKFRRIPLGVPGMTLDVDPNNYLNSGIGIFEGKNWTERLGGVSPFEGGVGQTQSTVVPVRLPGGGAKGGVVNNIHAPMSFVVQGGDHHDPETLARYMGDLMTGHLLSTVEKVATEQGDDEGN